MRRGKRVHNSTFKALSVLPSKPHATSVSSEAAGVATPPYSRCSAATTSRPAARPSAAGSIAATWSAVGHARRSSRRIPASRPGSTLTARSWPGCTPMRRPSSRTRWTSTPIPRSARSEWSRASRPMSRRRATTTCITSPARSTGGPACFFRRGQAEAGGGTALLLAHLDDLRRQLRCYRKIHVICDRAACHTTDEVAMYLWDRRDRIDLPCCRHTARTATPLSGCGGTCTSRSPGTIRANRCRSCSP